jgi:uroporphyrinogen-III synthase
MHVLVTRPQSEADAFSAQLEALGHKVTIEPLLQLEFLPIAGDALAGASGLIATSRNGLRALAGSPAIDAARVLPFFAVGPGTAQLARDLGFVNVVAGPGTGADLVPVIAEAAAASAGPFVHVRGEEVAFDLKRAVAARGIEVREVIAYRARPTEALSQRTRDLLAAGEIDAVILMSPRTGLIFTRLVATEDLTDDARKLVLLCLSPAVAATIEPLAAARVEVAESPNAASMLGSVTRVATLWSGV